MGFITGEIVLAMSGVALLSLLLHYHVKGAFCIILIGAALIWWASQNSWPSTILNVPSANYFTLTYMNNDSIVLVFDLIFLSLLSLNGLISSLSDMGHIKRADGTTPRARWLFIMCGFASAISGILSGPPILISPESGDQRVQ